MLLIYFLCYLNIQKFTTDAYVEIDVARDLATYYHLVELAWKIVPYDLMYLN